MNSTPNQIQLGLEAFLESSAKFAKGARIGLLMNQASVNDRFEYASDLVAESLPGQLQAIFSPQHGIFGEQQANMIESRHGRAATLNIPVYSLYSETRRPTAEMLEGIDLLLIDLQDVGTRVYTFLWTMLECLRACASSGTRVLVLDRPNPIGGLVAEGPMLASDHKSFVGGFEIPLRHGLTIGEMARLFQRALEIDVDLEIVPMQGWNRSMYYPSTGRTWVAPSPNMPRFETTLLYPGQVLLEGINLSEGRGTTLPFEVSGAPFIDPYSLARELDKFPHSGIVIRPIRFQPTFDKWSGESCGGVAFHCRQPLEIRSVALSLSLIVACRQLYRDQVKWLPPPYEYEYEKCPIDILFGNDRFRVRLEDSKPVSPSEIESLTAFDEEAWRCQSEPSRLYR